ncbi:MAG: Tfx family DNA-binding protein [Candidatus Odinarchaeota archaeon]|nr:Tfx family DNA-binding protein [Candidatus Odinarchaeota archaeon]
MPKQKSFGLLTEKQLEVLALRKKGLSYKEIAKRLNTTRENIYILEKRGLRNIEIARETLEIAKHQGILCEIQLEAGTRLIEVPKIIVDEADKRNVKLKANFTRIYDEIRYKVPKAIERTRLARPVVVYITLDGDFWVESQRLEKTSK